MPCFIDLVVCFIDLMVCFIDSVICFIDSSYSWHILCLENHHKTFNLEVFIVLFYRLCDLFYRLGDLLYRLSLSTILIFCLKAHHICLALKFEAFIFFLSFLSYFIDSVICFIDSVICFIDCPYSSHLYFVLRTTIS